MNKSSDVYNNSLVNVQSLSDGDIIIQDNMWYCGPAALSGARASRNSTAESSRSPGPQSGTRPGSRSGRPRSRNARPASASS